MDWPSVNAGCVRTIESPSADQDTVWPTRSNRPDPQELPSDLSRDREDHRRDVARLAMSPVFTSSMSFHESRPPWCGACDSARVRESACEAYWVPGNASARSDANALRAALVALRLPITASDAARV